MKLRNRQTGEIGYTAVLQSKAIVVMDENAIQLGSYPTLAELNSEWEDAPEKPRTCWYLDCNGEPTEKSEIANYYNPAMKEIGNYFSSREEAEQAVEKLKAWKRLRDKGFKFDGWNGTQIGSNISYVSEVYYEGCADDMDLLFGGEE